MRWRRGLAEANELAAREDMIFHRRGELGVRRRRWNGRVVAMRMLRFIPALLC